MTDTNGSTFREVFILQQGLDVYKRTGLLPSELAAQRDELLEALNDLVILVGHDHLTAKARAAIAKATHKPT